MDKRRALREEGRIFCKETIREYLTEDLKGIDIHTFFEIDSTNTYLKEGIEERKNFETALADLQLKGRGRFGRTFESPKDGLYMSFVIDKKFYPIDTLTTIRAVVAAHRVLIKYEEDLKLKWVNDLYLHGKKIAGILTEGRVDIETGEIIKCVVGIGININTCDFSEEVSKIAGTLFIDENKNKIAAEILNSFYELKDASDEDIVKYFEKYHMLKDREVYFVKENKKFTGKVTGIDLNGYLKVLTHGGEILLKSGEVSVKTLDTGGFPY